MRHGSTEQPSTGSTEQPRSDDRLVHLWPEAVSFEVGALMPTSRNALILSPYITFVCALE